MTKTQDLAHRINHVLLCRRVTLWIEVLDEEGIDHPPVYHELLPLHFILHFLNEL